MTTAYHKIAFSILINRNGLNEEETKIKIKNKTIDELEKEVNAINSIKYAVRSVSEQLHLTEEESIKFLYAIVNGPKNADIFEIISNKTKRLSNEQKLNILSSIHDGWVIDNLNDKMLDKKIQNGQIRQYAPIELIGWNEVKNDLIFLNPILETIGISVDEISLENIFHLRVANYMHLTNINNQKDLLNLIKQGKNYYSVLNCELEKKLISEAENISKLIIQNWIDNDPHSYQILKIREEASIK